MRTLFWVGVFVVVALVLVAIEYGWARGRQKDRLAMQAEWDGTEAKIKAVLSEPGRETIIRDVALRAIAQQAHLDHICQITASAMQAPAAVITVVEVGGQRWLAHFGAEWCGDEVRAGLIAPLSTSYCKFVVTTDQTLVITNSLTDIRVRNADEVTLHQVQAYIGAPVHSIEGVPIGSLCVFDVKPRKWSARDRTVVESFASLVTL